MKQSEFTRRALLQSSGTIGVAKVGDKPGTGGKRRRADRLSRRWFVGDGNSKLYDAMTDNGGGMEDALASQKAIVDRHLEDHQLGQHRPAIYGGSRGRTPSATKARSSPCPTSRTPTRWPSTTMIGEELTSWEALFDEQFRGRAAMQNDFGPTLTNTAIYLKESGKQDIETRPT
jgi:putative spermidine/putrescine transport system substrate-binding protein